MIINQVGGGGDSGPKVVNIDTSNLKINLTNVKIYDSSQRVNTYVKTISNTYIQNTFAPIYSNKWSNGTGSGSYSGYYLDVAPTISTTTSQLATMLQNSGFGDLPTGHRTLDAYLIFGSYFTYTTFRITFTVSGGNISNVSHNLQINERQIVRYGSSGDTTMSCEILPISIT